MTSTALAPRKAVTQKQIAAFLNISQQTVSAAFNNNSGTAKVSDEKRKAIFEAAEALGHVPNHLARSLRSGRTHSIGVVMPYCNDPYFAAVVDALSHEALKRGYSIALQFHLWSEAEETAALERLMAAKVDGILLYPRGSETYLTHRLKDSAHRHPIVSLASATPGGLFKGILQRDYYLEGYLLAEALISKGHRKIDLLGINRRVASQQEKMRGIDDAIRDSGQRVKAAHFDLPEKLREEMEIVPAPLPSLLNVLQRMVHYYFSNRQPGSAVIVGNEMIASMVAFTALKNAIALDGDLAIGYAGISGTHQIGMPATVVQYDAGEFASHAFDLLFAPHSGSYRLTPRLTHPAHL